MSFRTRALNQISFISKQYRQQQKRSLDINTTVSRNTRRFQQQTPINTQTQSRLCLIKHSNPSITIRTFSSTPQIYLKMTANTRSSDNSPPSKKSKTSESKEDSSSEIQNGSKGADHEVQGEHNQWKFRAPYQLQDEGSFENKFEGGCHCGRVVYHIRATEPLESKYCHCTTCQALHGSPFGWTAVFNKEDVKFVNGHHDLTWYDSMEKTTRHKLPCKVTCSYCHASVMDEGNNKLLIYPGTIKFKDQKEKDHFKGSYHMFYGERVMDINDGLPKWEGMKDDSKLLEEKKEKSLL